MKLRDKYKAQGKSKPRVSKYAAKKAEQRAEDQGVGITHHEASNIPGPATALGDALRTLIRNGVLHKQRTK